MNFEEWRSKRKYFTVEEILADKTNHTEGEWDPEYTAGIFAYPCGYIELMTPKAFNETGKLLFLLIENQDWSSNDFSELEEKLWKNWVVHEMDDAREDPNTKWKVEGFALVKQPFIVSNLTRTEAEQLQTKYSKNKYYEDVFIVLDDENSK